ncbi:MAG: DNA polymerase ligase N-terminal domain-containing protein [Candidatus Levyibacteriota bacterium]
MKEQLVFVIHKHKATNLHYDFRLQIGNVMPSWAIAKGPSLDNAVKRLALSTTDHDMAYRHFEGVIPQGGYGAGPVMIWDEGYYIPEIEVSKGVREAIADSQHGNKVMMEGLEKGELKFVLHGKKMKGSFALVKTKGWGPKNSWLLIKHKDDFVQEGYDANEYDFSAVSNKSVDEIAKG